MCGFFCAQFKYIYANVHNLNTVTLPTFPSNHVRFTNPYLTGNFGFNQQGVARVITGCNLAKPKTHFMTLKEKIALRLKAKAAGVNLSKTRIDAIVARAEKGLTDESDDTAIDANLDVINELTPFKDIASLDDHERAKAKKIADDKEAARIKAIEDGKTEDVELPADTPEWMKSFMKQQAATNKALEEKLASFGQEKVATTRREQYAKTLEGLPEALKADKLADFDLLNFKDDDHFNTWNEGKAESYKALIQENANDGLGGDRPAGGFVKSDPKGEKEVSPAMKELIAERAAKAEAKTA